MDTQAKDNILSKLVKCQRLNKNQLWTFVKMIESFESYDETSYPPFLLRKHFPYYFFSNNAYRFSKDMVDYIIDKDIGNKENSVWDNLKLDADRLKKVMLDERFYNNRASICVTNRDIIKGEVLDFIAYTVGYYQILMYYDVRKNMTREEYIKALANAPVRFFGVLLYSAYEYKHFTFNETIKIFKKSTEDAKQSFVDYLKEVHINSNEIIDGAYDGLDDMDDEALDNATIDLNEVSRFCEKLGIDEDSFMKEDDDED